MITENGYYRVKKDRIWQVGKVIIHDKSSTRWQTWLLIDNKSKFAYTDFDEIDPQRIIMPDEKEDII